jgi:single-strand DNA-binding protein
MEENMPEIVGKTGNLTKDPVLGVSPKGKTYCRFSMAVNPYAPKGQPKPDPIFYEVTCFDSLAENVCASLVKGDRVVVAGRPELNEWTGDDGIARTTKKIIADGCGPDLRFAEVQINKVKTESKTIATSAAEDDEEF